MSFYLGPSGFRNSTKSFVFSLKNNDNLKPFKSPVDHSQKHHAINTDITKGPSFGDGHVIHIVDNAAKTTGHLSHADLKETYKPPPGYTVGASNTKNLLAGTNEFRPTEIEVFYER